MNLKTKLAQLIWRQRWIGLRYKKSAHRHLKEQGEAPDAPFSTDFFGQRYEGNLANGIEFAIYYYGAFEKPLLFFLRDTAARLREHNKSPIVFCDIGSNIGQHALFMSQHADTVHAFEPYEPVCNKLAHHIALNNLSNIRLHDVGLGENTVLMNFYAPTGSNQGIGSFTSESLERGTEDIGKLQVVNGDSYFADNNITTAQLIKIDVEGFEKPALRGLAQFLQAHRPIVVCEVTYGESHSFESIDDLLAALPANYSLLQFDKRDANGRVVRRRGSRSKRNGSYQLSSFDKWWGDGQDDVIAVPSEHLDLIPMSNS